MTDKTNGNGLTFKQWMKLVNRAVYAKCLMTCDDLADCCYWDWWNDDMSPADAADMVLQENDFDLFDNDFDYAD